MFDQVIFPVYKIIILLFSVILHEISHGFFAKLQGDNTAEAAGRLTLNPLSHIDIFGSIFLPLILYFATMGNFVIGWAKPVPFNPANLKNKKWGPALVALAGPLTNIFIAIIFGLLIRFSYLIPFLPPSFISFLSFIVLINLLLAVFNLLPIPPLDGSKLLFSFLTVFRKFSSGKLFQIESWFERYGFILLLIFIFFGFNLILPIIFWLYKFITGQPFGF